MLHDESFEGSFLRYLRIVRQCVIFAVSANDTLADSKGYALAYWWTKPRWQRKLPSNDLSCSMTAPLEVSFPALSWYLNLPFGPGDTGWTETRRFPFQTRGCPGKNRGYAAILYIISGAISTSLFHHIDLSEVCGTYFCVFRYLKKKQRRLNVDAITDPVTCNCLGLLL